MDNSFALQRSSTTPPSRPLDDTKLHFFGVNQDASRFAIGTDSGFVVYDVDPPRVRFQRDFDGGIGIVELLFCTNVVALVGGGTKPKFPKYKIMIWDDYLSDCIAEFVFQTEVMGVKLRRDRVIAILEKEVYEYDFSTLELLGKYDTWPNPEGIGCISHGKGDPILVTLGQKSGEVRITTCATKKSRTILAHDHPVSQMCLSEDGTKLATTSERGTKVRLVDTTNGTALQEFTRGSYGATISSLAFNSQANMIILTSNTGTIHLFACEVPDAQPAAGFGLTSWVSPNYWLATTKSIAQLSIPQENYAKGAILKSETNDSTSIIILGVSGVYYKYVYAGGQWTQQHSIQHFFKNGIPL